MGNLVATLNATIRADQKLMLIQYAESTGKVSVSEALREILDDWNRMRQATFVHSPGYPENDMTDPAEVDG